MRAEVDDHGGDGGRQSTEEERRRTRPVDRQKPVQKGAERSDLAATVILLGRLTGLGWYVAASIAGGTVAGYWLDGKFGTSPLLTIVGLAVGIVVAGFGVFRLLRAFGHSRPGRNDQTQS